MDSIAQGPLDLSRFETPDIEDKIPALTQEVVAGRRRRKVPSTLTPLPRQGLRPLLRLPQGV